MTDSSQLMPGGSSSGQTESGQRTLTHVLYALYAVHWLTGGVTGLIAIIINYVKRADVVGTPFEPHFTWQIRTFWISLIAYLLGAVLAVVGVGFVLLGLAWVWTLYRIIKGWLALKDGKSFDPRAWF